MSGAVNVTGATNSVQSGQRTFAPYNIIGSFDIGETLVVALGQGDNTFAVPEHAVGVVIIPPNNELNTDLWTLRTSLNPSDAGLPIVVNLPTMYVFPTTPPTTITINASVAQTGVTDLWFW